MNILKGLICCLLFISITASAADAKLFVQIRDNAVEMSSEEGELYFGAYLYALASASTVHTELFFTGDSEAAMTIFRDTVSAQQDNFFRLASIEYFQDKEYILAVLIDGYCSNYWGNYSDCFYDVIISKR